MRRLHQMMEANQINQPLKIVVKGDLSYRYGADKEKTNQQGPLERNPLALTPSTQYLKVKRIVL